MSTVFIQPQALQKKKAAVKKETLTKAETLKRINNLEKASVVAQTTGQAATTTGFLAPFAAFGSTVVGAGLNRQALGVAATRFGAVARFSGPVGFGVGIGLTALGFVLQKGADKLAEEVVNNTPPDPQIKSPFPPAKFEYNLPPHTWSLPVRPNIVDGTSGVGNVSRDNHGGEFHRLRRGVIWNWTDGSNIAKNDNGVLKTAADLQKVTAAADKNNKIYNEGSGKQNSYNYGFQFLWNPETITSSIARNMDVTPSSADRFRSVVGAFPGQETYQFQILLDRVNDFACLRSMAGSTVQGKGNGTFYDNFQSSGERYIQASNIPSEATKFYNTSLGTVSAAQKLQQINDLLRLGTMADIEYLFKALNGNGANQKGEQWRTLLNKKTANIGFLSPSLLAFRFGPNSQQQLSFVGWITNLSINHTMFTEDMVPIRTTLSFSCDAFAGSTVV